VALRVPSHPVALNLLRSSGKPIAAPSANLFGYVSPTEARHVAEQLGDRVDLILDGGPCSVGIESTIISLTSGRPAILRAGGVSPDQLESVIGPVAWATTPASRPVAPGQLTRHYATRTPLRIEPRDQSARAGPGERVGLICLTRPLDVAGFSALEILSEAGDLREAAANFFAALRRLDALGLDRLVAWPVPEHDLGIAIMDRLRRCAVGDPGQDTLG
jgi:L-threonylcarbamoyladenylate synthase